MRRIRMHTPLPDCSGLVYGWMGVSYFRVSVEVTYLWEVHISQMALLNRKMGIFGASRVHKISERNGWDTPPWLVDLGESLRVLLRPLLSGFEGNYPASDFEHL